MVGSSLGSKTFGHAAPSLNFLWGPGQCIAPSLCGLGLLPLQCPSSRVYLELFKEQAAVLAE